MTDTPDFVPTVDIVFDGPPSHRSGRFVETECPPGTGIGYGEWVQRPDGFWALRVPDGRAVHDLYAALEAALAIHGTMYSWGPKARAALAKARQQ